MIFYLRRMRWSQLLSAEAYIYVPSPWTEVGLRKEVDDIDDTLLEGYYR